MIREEASEPFRAERVPISHRHRLGLGLRSRRFGDSDWRGGWNGMTKTLNCADYDEDDPKRKSSRSLRIAAARASQLGKPVI
jgi:hypothetical protein